MQKEILTKEKCVIDLLETAKFPKAKAVRWAFLAALLSTVAACIVGIFREFIFYHTSLEFGENFLVIAIMSGTVLFFLGIIYLSLLFYIAAKRRRIQNGDFRIVEDKLVRSHQDVHYSTSVRDTCDLLIFDEYGDFYLHNYDYYKWTSHYQTNARGVFDSSGAWDTFYLVIYPNNENGKALMVYNTKMFEYTEERD